jgi:hypothetical protein
MFWLRLLVTLLLICIAYEDFKHRMVKLIYYLLLIVALLFIRFETIQSEDFFIHFGMNLAYLLLLLSTSLLTLYLFRRKVSNPLIYIGLGDLILLFTFCLWFDLLNFLIFNTISLILALLIHVVLSRYPFYSKHGTIPLAGIQCLCFFLVFINDFLQ